MFLMFWNHLCPQSQSDEKALIAKLHQHLVALQLSEATALGKLQVATAQVQQLEAYKLRAEQRLDAGEHALFLARQEGRNRCKHLRQTVQALRRQFTGALPLKQQEKFSTTMLGLLDDKARAQQERKKAVEESRRAEARTEELELRLRGLEELIATLKDVKGAQKVRGLGGVSVYICPYISRYLCPQSESRCSVDVKPNMSHHK